jgi:hypothetical protein
VRARARSSTVERAVSVEVAVMLISISLITQRSCIDMLRG